MEVGSVSFAEVSGLDDSSSEKKRGRPKGSKNKSVKDLLSYPVESSKAVFAAEEPVGRYFEVALASENLPDGTPLKAIVPRDKVMVATELVQGGTAVLVDVGGHQPLVFNTSETLAFISKELSKGYW